MSSESFFLFNSQNTIEPMSVSTRHHHENRVCPTFYSSWKPTIYLNYFLGIDELRLKQSCAFKPLWPKPDLSCILQMRNIRKFKWASRVFRVHWRLEWYLSFSFELAISLWNDGRIHLRILLSSSTLYAFSEKWLHWRFLVKLLTIFLFIFSGKARSKNRELLGVTLGNAIIFFFAIGRTAFLQALIAQKM